MGALWQGLALGLSKSAVLITTIVLARILTPDQFGLVALAVVIVGYAQTIADAGVGQALVYLPGERSIVRAATLCAAAVGVALTAAAIGSAPLLASFFLQPRVAPLIQLCAFSLLAASLASVPESLLRRELLFRRITVARGVSAAVTAVASIALVIGGANEWAIAWGQVLGAVSYTVVAWIAVPSRPDARIWRTTWADIRAVLTFGLPVAGATFLARAIFDVDYIIVGRLLGTESLAYYTLAFKLPEMAILTVFFVIISVTFPLYARAASDPERLRRGYVFSFQLQALYGLAAGAGLAAVAPLAIQVFFGDRWAAAAVPLAALALYAALRTVGGGANEIYKALGRPGISVRMSIVRLVILIPALIFATRWGIVGVAWMQVAVTLVFAVGMQTVALRVLELRPRRLLAALVPALSVAAAVGVSAYLLAHLPVPAMGALLIAVVGGVIAAVGVLAVVNRPLLREIVSLAARRSTAV